MIILNSDWPWSWGRWLLWAALLTFLPRGAKRMFSFISSRFTFIPPAFFPPFDVLFLAEFYSKVRGLKLWFHIGHLSFIFFFTFFLNSHSKAPHHLTSHPSHLPAASISKFLSIFEYYIGFTELWETKCISMHPSPLQRLFANFSPLWIYFFIRDLIYRSSRKVAHIPLDKFKQLMLKNFSEILTMLEIRCPAKHLFISQKHFSLYMKGWATCSPSYWKCKRHWYVCLTERLENLNKYGSTGGRLEYQNNSKS